MEKEFDYDTHMIEPEEEEFFDTSEKILKLSDALAEEIILENISEQLENDVQPLHQGINYVSLFKEKYSEIDPSDDFYDKDYMMQSLTNLCTLVENGIKEKFGVEIGEGIDFALPSTHLKDMETLYEFLVIRHFENLKDYYIFKLKKDRAQFVQKYSKLIQEDEHAKDLFVIQAKKKFKNEDDVVILHFINEIIEDITDETISAYLLFDTIVNIDLFEEYNNRMYELLQDYGNKIVLNEDQYSAELYLKPLKDPAIKNELRNAIIVNYLESCELED